MEFYTVKAGESLSIIARDVLNDISRWPDIARVNNLVSPYTIYPGQQLILPDVEVLGPVVVPAGTTRLPVPTPTPTPTPTPARTLGLGLTQQQWLYIGLAAGALFLFSMMDRR